ncbi:hypothetical protein GCM10027093_33720 [Paraburkholderia jirisanensis]
MAKFACRCGYIINLIVSPNENEWTFISQRVVEDIVVAIDESKMRDGEYFYEMLQGDEITVYRCPSCGRLHLEEAGRNKFVTYIKELSS